MCSWIQQKPQQREARKTKEKNALLLTTGEDWIRLLKRLQCFV